MKRGRKVSGGGKKEGRKRTLTTLELALLLSYHSNPPLTYGNCDTLAINLGS